MVRLSLTKRLEALEAMALPSATPSDRVRHWEQLRAFLAADSAYQEAVAITDRFESPSQCLADPEGRAAAKVLAERLAAANRGIEGR